MLKAVEPKDNDDLEPGAGVGQRWLIFACALSCGLASGTLTDWHTGCTVFSAVLALFTTPVPRRRP